MEGTEFARLTGSYNTAYIGTWELLNQNPITLISTFKLRGYFYYGGGTQVTNNGSFAFYLDDTKIHSGTYYSYTPGTHFLGEKTITVTHNADGSFPGRDVTISTSGNYMHVQGSTKGTISGVPSISVMPTELIKSSIIYYKKEGIWHKAIGYFKANGVFKKTREFLKGKGEWQ